jgi:hypothetical protein
MSSSHQAWRSHGEPEKRLPNLWHDKTALLAVEKDFPAGIEPSLSAKQIEQIPAEIENRVPDLCVNRSDVWLV